MDLPFTDNDLREVLQRSFDGVLIRGVNVPPLTSEQSSAALFALESGFLAGISLSVNSDGKLMAEPHTGYSITSSFISNTGMLKLKELSKSDDSGRIGFL